MPIVWKPVDFVDKKTKTKKKMRFQSQKVARNNIIYQQYLPQSPRECLVTTMVRASPLGHNMAHKGTRIEEPKRFSYLFVTVVMAIFNPRRLTLQPSKCG